jgi:hypothetical protein
MRSALEESFSLPSPALVRCVRLDPLSPPSFCCTALELIPVSRFIACVGGLEKVGCARWAILAMVGGSRAPFVCGVGSSPCFLLKAE